MSMWNEQYASTWTIGAIECYKRGCRCEGCLIKEFLETRCEMKKAVLALVRKYGAPSKPQEKEKMPNKKQTIILNAIKNGAENYEELEEITKIKYHSLQVNLTILYAQAASKGLKFKNKKYKLPEFVRWVRGNY